MNSEDVVYLSVLIFSLGFGSYYRKLPDAQSKRKTGALVGFIIVVLVSRLHTLHVLITTFFNALIVLYVDERRCHVVSFIFSFIYLFFFRSTTYFGIPYPPSHTNLIQMILTLKLVGLAFEVNSAYITMKKRESLGNMSEEERIEDHTNHVSRLTITFSDVFYYAFNYCGVLTGPYFRYRTFNDHLYARFNRYDDYKSATVKRLFPWVPIFAIIYLVSDYVWPLSYTLTTDFEHEPFLYRYWYIWPTYLTFRMRIYIGLILSECVCIMAGVGVYPAFTNPKSGQGPTAHFVKMAETCLNENALINTKYNYDTVYNMNPYASEFYPTMREAMRNWNITVQFWLVMCVHKRFPSKRFRTFVTMFVSAVWHGVYIGYYICICSVPICLLVEDIWAQVLLEDDFFMPKSLGKLVMWFLKMQVFSYLCIAFGLLEVKKIMHYYNSVYHCVPVLYFILYFMGNYLLKLKKMQVEENRLQKENNENEKDN